MFNDGVAVLGAYTANILDERDRQKRTDSVRNEARRPTAKRGEKLDETADLADSLIMLT